LAISRKKKEIISKLRNWKIEKIYLEKENQEMSSIILINMMNKAILFKENRNPKKGM
jgi:hypothetical protein